MAKQVESQNGNWALKSLGLVRRAKVSYRCTDIPPIRGLGAWGCGRRMKSLRFKIAILDSTVGAQGTGSGFGM